MSWGMSFINLSASCWPPVDCLATLRYSRAFVVTHWNKYNKVYFCWLLRLFTWFDVVLIHSFWLLSNCSFRWCWINNFNMASQLRHSGRQSEKKCTKMWIPQQVRFSPQLLLLAAAKGKATQGRCPPVCACVCVCVSSCETKWPALTFTFT